MIKNPTSHVINTPPRIIQQLKQAFVFLILFYLSACASNGPTPEELAAQAAAAAQQEKVRQENILREQIGALNKAALNDINNSRLKHPKGNNALEKVQKIETLDPKAAEPSLLREMITQQYANLIKIALGQEDLSKAQLYLTNAKSIAPKSEGAQQAQTWINAFQQEQKRRQAEKKKRQIVANLQKKKRLEAENKLATQRRLQMLPKKQQTALIQSEVNARSKEVGFQLDKLSAAIIKNNQPVTIRAQSQRDFRWLAALLKTSLYVVDSSFEPVISHEINNTSEPAIYYLVPQQ